MTVKKNSRNDSLKFNFMEGISASLSPIVSRVPKLDGSFVGQKPNGIISNTSVAVTKMINLL